MIITEETIISLLQKIRKVLNYEEDKTADDIILADEINSVDFYDSSFKIMDIFKHDYTDYHFQFCDLINKFFDIFVYEKENIDQSKLLQMILCDNYVAIVRFKQGEYEKRKTVTEFKLPQKIYSFYDRSIIIVERDEPTKTVYYKKI